MIKHYKSNMVLFWTTHCRDLPSVDCAIYIPVHLHNSYTINMSIMQSQRCNSIEKIFLWQICMSDGTRMRRFPRTVLIFVHTINNDYHMMRVRYIPGGNHPTKMSSFYNPLGLCVNVIKTSWHGNTFRITATLLGVPSGHRWISLT